MTNLNNKIQNNVKHNSNKGETKMIERTQKVSKGFERKLSTAYQQNIIEMLNLIYLYPKSHTKKSLAYEFTKNGVASERKIIRMINDANTFCPIIKRALNDVDFESHYYLDEKRFTETDIDNYYKKAQNAELLYIFMTAFLIKPISTEEVMAKINVNRKKANQIINKILDAAYLLDEIETDKGYIIGHTKFFK